MQSGNCCQSRLRNSSSSSTVKSLILTLYLLYTLNTKYLFQDGIIIVYFLHSIRSFSKQKTNKNNVNVYLKRETVSIKVLKIHGQGVIGHRLYHLSQLSTTPPLRNLHKKTYPPYNTVRRRKKNNFFTIDNIMNYL